MSLAPTFLENFPESFYKAIAEKIPQYSSGRVSDVGANCIRPSETVLDWRIGSSENISIRELLRSNGRELPQSASFIERLDCAALGRVGDRPFPTSNRLHHPC